MAIAPPRRRHASPVSFRRKAESRRWQIRASGEPRFLALLGMTRLTLGALIRAALLVGALALIGSSGAVGILAQETDAAFEAELERIARETAALRELPPLDDVDDVVLTAEELRAMMPDLMAEEMDPDQLAAQARALAALGLIPEGLDLLDLTVRMMGEQAMGFYDPLTDEMIVVAAAPGDLGIGEYFYAHEIGHALQDAHLDPDDVLENRDTLNGDEALAALALYEGDAVVTSNLYLTEHPALALKLLRELQTEYVELDTAPAALSATLVFPYSSGLAFVERLRTNGGWEAVNAAYSDVPTSTEQILHPRKYLARDDPTPVALPEPGTALGAAWTLVSEDTLGELQTALLLANLGPGEGFDPTTGRLDLPERARNAAAGWDGDRFALWENVGAGQEALVWRSVWDTPEDARAFGRALAQFGNERWDGVFNGESPDDVALVTPAVAARIMVAGTEVFFAQAADLPTADAALAAVQSASRSGSPAG
jgi:hypothetical protein